MIAEVVPRISRYCGLEKGVMIWLIVAVLPLDLDLIGEVFRVIRDAAGHSSPSVRQCSADRSLLGTVAPHRIVRSS